MRREVFLIFLWRSGIVMLCSLAFVGCSRFFKDATQVSKKLSPEVIYGDDNRQEISALETLWTERARATVALVDHRKLIAQENGQYHTIKTYSYGLTYHLCEDERFYEQPTLSFCSGFLVGPDLIATAGHCLRNSSNCSNVRFVFDYNDSLAPSEWTQLPSQNIYECQALLFTQTNAVTGVDFAIARLDRVVNDRTPVTLRPQGTLAVEDSLRVIGHPSGLPAKWADQGRVLDNSPRPFFITDLDTYGGNSGSAVFNEKTGWVEGVLVRGDTDFQLDPVSQCRRSNICDPLDCDGEEVVRSEEVLKELSQIVDPNAKNE